MVLDNFLDHNLRNVSLDEAAMSIIYLMSTLAQYGAATISLSLFTSIGLSDVLFTFAGGDVTVSLALGGGVLLYNAATSGFGWDALQRLNLQEQIVVVLGVGLMGLQPFIAEVNNWVTGAHWQTAVAVLLATLAYGVIANYGDE